MDNKKIKEAVKKKRKKSNMVTFQTHPVLLEKIGDVRAMAIYHYYKAYFLNSTIYDFSYNKVAKDLNISWRSAKKYIDILLNAGWARRHGKNLTFVKIRLIGIKYRVKPTLYQTIRIKRGFKLQDIEDILYTLSINNNGKRQIYVQSIKHDRKLIEQGKSLPLSRTKKIMKLTEKGEYLGECYDNVIFSMRNLADKWNVSPSKASIIVRRLKSKQLITIKPKIDIICKNFKGNISDMIRGDVKHLLSVNKQDEIKIEDFGFGYFFKSGNNLCIHRGTQLTSISSILYTSITNWIDKGEFKRNQIDCVKLAEA